MDFPMRHTLDPSHFSLIFFASISAPSPLSDQVPPHTYLTGTIQFALSTSTVYYASAYRPSSLPYQSMSNHMHQNSSGAEESNRWWLAWSEVILARGSTHRAEPHRGFESRNRTAAIFGVLSSIGVTGTFPKFATTYRKLKLRILSALQCHKGKPDFAYFDKVLLYTVPIRNQWYTHWQRLCQNWGLYPWSFMAMGQFLTYLWGAWGALST